MKTAKEMWDTVKSTHGNINESKEVRSRSQARRKRRQNKKKPQPLLHGQKGR